jgi:hypothetical protein
MAQFAVNVMCPSERVPPTVTGLFSSSATKRPAAHKRYNLHARGAAKRPFPSKALTTLLPPSPLRLLLGGTNHFPGGATSH